MRGFAQDASEAAGGVAWIAAKKRDGIAGKGVGDAGKKYVAGGAEMQRAEFDGRPVGGDEPADGRIAGP